MAYVKTQDGQVQKFPYSIGNLRQDNPHTSFPKHIPEQALASYGVFEVSLVSPPEVNARYEKAVRDDLPSLVGGSWVMQWQVVEKTPEEQQDYTDDVARGVSNKRNSLLGETDWMALSDNTMTPEWATYRQALRDITSHANFPYLNESDWPVKPA